MIEISPMTCRLCSSAEVVKLDFVLGPRQFFLCNTCRLIMADEGSFPGQEEEKQRYLLHKNDPGNDGYVRFLSQLTDSLQALLGFHHTCLDYGCGPVPVLAGMLENMGINCRLYDPYFFPEMPEGTFDLVVSTECFEHFFYPASDITKVLSKVKNNGMLGTMTELWDSIDKFGNWHYIRDKTHVSFFHMDTMEWISENFGLNLIYTDRKRVVIWQKPG